jgi:protein-S-isoprenylcysteine O-methyltransferase Ste14
MNNDTNTEPRKTSSNQAAVRLLLQMIAVGTFVSLLLFISAGRLNWIQGWVFVTLWFVTKLSYVALVAKYDPELTAERANRHKNTQTYDRVLMTAYILMGFGAFLVAGLEARYYPQRFTLTAPTPIILMLLGIVVHLVLNGLTMWAMLTNTYHSSESRLQTERDQQVVTDGPYGYIRHPTYFAAFVMWLTTPMILGSWWALLPAAVAAALMVARTLFEDRMLKRELPGYAEYAQEVRYRLLPGVW